MSAPPSPQVAHGKAQHKVKGRPPALELPDISVKAASDGEIHYEHASVNHETVTRATYQPNVQVIPAEEQPQMESEYPVSRSASATSSLDPYYFGIRSPSDSPVPPLPSASTQLSSTTPDQRQFHEPVTPARDPASIDRRGLVGVGELATPRWTRAERTSEDTLLESEAVEGAYDVVIPEDVEHEDPDSPWTIEAVDGESSEKEELPDTKLISRPLRTRHSVADESGGEEILYPRQPIAALPKAAKAVLVEEPEAAASEPSTLPTVASSPPTSFTQRRARKRTSDEFELDQAGVLVSKVSGSKDRVKEEKAMMRKHRSVGSSSTMATRDKGRERHRDSTGNISASSSFRTPTARAPEKHSRQASAGSSSSNLGEPYHPRRSHTTDYSHLPPSPSSSSIQQFLKHSSSTSSRTPPLGNTAHSSPNVAHSLLRGTQEGWSGLDDEATAEALRKLDGLTGKSARARASVGSFGRPTSLSRPTTPPNISDAAKISRRSSTKDQANKEQGSDHAHLQSIGIGILLSDQGDTSENGAAAVSSDDQRILSGQDKTPKKTGTSSARSSFTPKRGSTSSTTYTSTPTTSSRDSATMSVTTNATSVSATSGRYSTGKARRNSAGSDVSSIHSSDAASLKDRVASLAVNGDAQEEALVPPVPPLPKDLSTFKTPPMASSGISFPSVAPGDDRDKKRSSHDSNEKTHGMSLEVPQIGASNQLYHSQPPSGYSSVGSGSESLSPAAPKTPSKKWSFSGLNLKLPGSSPATSKALSPRSATFGQQLRKSTSKDQPLSLSANPPAKPWTPTRPEAMSSAASLASMSSVGSVQSPPTPSAVVEKAPDGGSVPSRSGTDSSASTNHTTSAIAALPKDALSPTSSVRRGQSQKRLTPSSIPFFRRSSSQSMQMPPPALPPASPTLSSGDLSSAQARNKGYDSSYNPPSTSTPASKKTSVLSLGLPSLLKGSSSRRSLHEAAKENQKAAKEAKEIEKEKLKQEKLEKEKQKREDKDRSESRISVLMGRKRGKTLSAADPRKPKSPVSLPPMQISALEPATAQRVARLKSSNSSLSTPPATSTRTPSTSSRLMSQTASSLAKQSDSSLRSRNQLPTIAGSPSVGTITSNSSHTLKEGRDGPPSSSTNASSSLPKETPTKIPRISSRTSTTSSPPLKPSSSTLVNRRASVNVTTVAASSANPSPTGFSANEFGVMENGESQTPKTMAGPTRHGSIRASPSTVSTSRVPRQVSAPTSSTSTSVLPRKSNRDSISFSGLRKSSTGSVTSTASATAPSEIASHRFSALSPSKGLNKLLSPKISHPSSRSSNSSSVHRAVTSPTSSQQSLSTPSPVPSTIDEEELLGDEEMMHYIRRQQAKKLASGATQEELDELLRFPEPMPPAPPLSPSAVLKGSQHQHLSDYERKEILDYPSVYYIGAKSKKKPATPDNSTNNYGYDDERGDYLVVYHDHLAYRYEVIDTLGKGSFGQVLHCRDHCTGESVAIKIIRNKKRFHHQALIEIKILDNLRKWDAEEKHHVIKMTEHFYFRNHLCIAMELLSINLYELIKANGFVGFTTTLIRRFTSQMLLSLSLMRHHRIVHCDLKPENVLLKHPMKSAIKVIDFGSSCFEHEKIYTYIQSRFYRSPEVILGMNYHMAIDMWSLGCILAELYTGFPIFPGENEQEQLACIMEVLGTPDKDFINRSSRKKLFFDPNGAPRPFVNQKGRRRRPGTKTLAQVLRCNDEDFVDFIAKCLVWDPERRIKPQAAMRHPFVTAGKRPKPTSSTSSKTLSGLTSRSKTITETPKKSQISAPTPLTARTSRTSGLTAGPTTPSNSAHASTIGSSSRSYRTSQSQVLSSSYHSSRTLNGFASTASK